MLFLGWGLFLNLASCDIAQLLFSVWEQGLSADSVCWQRQEATRDLENEIEKT